MAIADPYVASQPSISKIFNEGYMAGEDLLNYPEIMDMIFPFLKEEKTIVDFMISSGRKKRTVQTVYNWHEEDSLIPMIKIKSVAGTPGAGNAVTITMEALNADKEIPVKFWDTWRVGGSAGANGWIEKAADITVDGGGGEHSFILKPVKNTVDIVTLASAGDYVVWTGAAKADGTAMPGSMMSKPLPYSGQTQIIATNYTTNGSAAANKAWTKTKSGNELFYYRGVEQAVVRQKIAIAYTLLIGQGSVGLLDTAHADGSTAVNTTAGLDETMRDSANNGANSAFSFSELQLKINSKLDELFSGEEYFALVGNKLKYQIDNILLDRNFDNTSANYGVFATDNWLTSGTGKDRAVSYRFTEATLGTRSFYFRQEKSLYYPQITGAPGMNYPLTGYFLPADQVRDPNSGEYMDSICLRYKESDRENRFTDSWFRDKKTDDIDKFRFNHQSEVGWQQAKVRQTYLWEQS